MDDKGIHIAGNVRRRFSTPAKWWLDALTTRHECAHFVGHWWRLEICLTCSYINPKFDHPYRHHPTSATQKNPEICLCDIIQ
jgi:hypothetical protein